MSKLTDLSIRSLPIPAKGQTTLWDDLSGFGVRVSQGGSKTFIVMKDRRRHTLGRYPTLQLKDAREKARALLARLTLGEQYNPSVTFQELFDLFFAVQCVPQRNKARTIHDYKRLLTKHFAPFNSKALKDITSAQISGILQRLLDTPSEANHAYVAIRTILNFAVKRHLLTKSPTQSLEMPAKTTPVERVLSDAELVQILSVARDTPSQFSQLLTVLAYTGQRRSEIAALRWEYINNGTITLPATLTKNKREHCFPIPETIQTLLATLPRTSVYVFPNAKGEPFNNFSNGKAEFDKLCRIPAWTIHALRKTLSTNLAALRVPIDTTEAILNHITGSRTPLQRIYDRHSRLPAMQQALDLYDRHLQGLLGGRRCARRSGRGRKN